jgi:hypothetical protein
VIDAPGPADHIDASVDLDTVGHTAVTLAVEHPGQVPVDALVMLLRATGAVGWVRCEGPEHVLLMPATTCVGDGVDRLVVLRDAVLVTGPAVEDVVDETIARCGVHSSVAETSEDDGPPAQDGRRVIAYRTHRPLDRPAALEVASLLGTDVVLVPVEGWVLVVPADEDVDPFTPWSRHHRPVLSLRHGSDGALDVTAHLKGGGSSGGFGARALDRSLPGWWWSSSAQRVEVLVASEQRAGLDEATAAALAQLQGEPDPAATTALLAQLPPTGLDLRRLLAVDATANGALADAVAALGLPQVTTRLLSGEVAAEDLPGALTGERRGTLGLIVETLLARPGGNTPLARMRRWDHDHPARSVTYIVTAGSLAACGYALAAVDGHALSRRPWPRVLTATATGLTLDAAMNAVLLTVTRRRLRRRAR